MKYMLMHEPDEPKERNRDSMFVYLFRSRRVLLFTVTVTFLLASGDRLPTAASVPSTLH